MKTFKEFLLKEVDSRPQYDKIKALYDHPSTHPNIKAAAKAVMDKMKAEDRVSDTSSASHSIPYGHYVHSKHPEGNKYYGPYTFDADAQRAKSGMNMRGEKTHVLYSHNTGTWRNRDNRNAPHEFDKTATFPHLNKRNK
jgi:hypothetical protein